MKNRFWGTDLMVAILTVVSVALAVALGLLDKTYLTMSVIAVIVVAIVVFSNAHAVRRIIRGVFFGYGKQSARQQLSFENLNIPVAIVNKGSIVWYNNAFRMQILQDSDCYLAPLSKVVPEFSVEAATGTNGVDLIINSREYTAFSAKASEDDSLWVCYFTDDTELKWEAREYHLTRPVVMHIVVDTYDEVLKELKESKRAQLMAELDQLIEETANAAKGVSTKISSSRYHIVMEERYFNTIYDGRFEILSKARNLEQDMVTLSIGAGRGGEGFAENDMLARQALDMALGRGGDQAVIKNMEGYEFFGGILPSVEKRSKVRSRIVAKALRDVILQSDTVLIMGHSNSDLDAIGSGVGVAALAQSLGKKAYVVVRDDVTLAYNLIDKVRKTPGFEDLFLTPEKAQPYVMGAGTLLIVVDTHTARMTESADIVSKCARKVVIDHHRRMVDYINDTVVSYHEAYASSTSELVCELMPYIVPAGYKLNQVVAEAMLAGIMLDTRNFAEKAGVRTFEAAAWLRRQGAVSTEVQRLFSVPKEVYQTKSNLVNDAFIYKGVAVSLAENISRELYVAVPQAANDLLTLDEVYGSVVAVKFDDVISVSARSLGEINVQVLMEYLGGGGHLTMAGAQLKGMTIEQAGEKIKDSIDNYKK